MTDLEKREVDWLRENSKQLLLKYGSDALRLIEYMPESFSDEEIFRRVNSDKATGIFEYYFRKAGE